MMENRLKEILKDIATRIVSQMGAENMMGLMVGDAGKLLFLQQYLTHINQDEDMYSFFCDYLEKMATYSDVIQDDSFSSGKAGVHWFYAFLHTSGLIDSEVLGVLCSNDELLLDSSLNAFKQGNLDFLHGGLGIVYYLLYTNERVKTDYFEDIFSLLKEQLKSSDGMFAVESAKYSHEVNMGLAHGIPAVLKFCIECYRKEICKTDAKFISDEIINYLCRNIKKAPRQSYYSYSVANGKGEEHSRLAWCYGDLSTGYILYQAAKELNNTPAADFAMEILTHSAQRRATDDTQVHDAGICHGSAGLAHMYNRFWHETQNISFKEARDFWLQKTLDLAEYDHGVVDYKKYNLISNAWENDYNLLEGTAGIGLVMISYLTNDFHWDYSIMLNN